MSRRCPNLDAVPDDGGVFLGFFSDAIDDLVRSLDWRRKCRITDPANNQGPESTVPWNYSSLFLHLKDVVPIVS